MIRKKSKINWICIALLYIIFIIPTAAPSGLPNRFIVFSNPIVYDQKNVPACAGYAVAGAISDIECNAGRKCERFDGMWLYNQAVNLNPRAYSGYPEIMEVLIKEGIPYENQARKEYYKIGKVIKIKAVKPEKFYTIKGDIYRNKAPLLVSTIWYKNWNNLPPNAILPKPDFSSDFSIHAFRIIGWIDTDSVGKKGYFIVVNSLGTSFGDNGKFYIPYDMIYLITRIGQNYIIIP